MDRRIAAIVLWCGLATAASPTFYKWRGGTLIVPTDFQESTRDYREGIVITLSYSDGSAIALQQGGMMQEPTFDVDEVIKQSDGPNRVSRSGADSKSGTFWRLDSYKRRPPSKKASITWLELFPPNIGYSHVSKRRKAEFDKALDSFELRR